jgi:His-Xaa-Ser system protein HxsD
MTSPHDVAGEVVAQPKGKAVPFELSWDKITTPLEAIDRATYALANRLTGSVSDAGESWTLTVHPRENADPHLLAHRIRQEVTDQTLRLRIAERTDPIRNLVFALAFSRSGLTPGSATDESEGETA